jgi:hypothetical protein
MEHSQKYSLVGTWRGSTGQTGFGEIYTETTLNADMTFATTQQSSAGVIRTSGPYELVNGNAIVFTNQNKWQSPVTLPGTSIGQSVNNNVTIHDKDTSYFRFVDENTIVIESAVPGIAPVTFRRNVPFPAPGNPERSQLFQSPILGTTFFTPSGTNPSMSSNKTMLYIFLAFVLASSLLAFCSLPSMP